MVFSGQQPVTANSGTHSAQTNLHHLSKGLNFATEMPVSSNQTSVTNHKGKRSLPDYNDLIQVSTQLTIFKLILLFVCCRKT